MAELTVPGATSVGITRLGRPAAAESAELGPLQDLVGTWHGSNGWELIAVPDVEHEFRVIALPVNEVITFSAIGAPVPNRGVPNDMFIAGLLYETRISNAVTHEPLHIENGMWLNLGPGSGDLPIARQASIPHGDVFLALGTATTIDGPPTIPDENATPIFQERILGYLEGEGGYGNPPKGNVPPELDYTKWTASLQKAITGLDIQQTVELSVSTESSGGIVNIPFVDAQANATSFTCTYWIETIAGPSGDQVVQLQYMQQTNLEFVKQKETGVLIVWPHVNSNTLRKQ
jgi:hypothetical protein